MPSANNIISGGIKMTIEEIKIDYYYKKKEKEHYKIPKLRIKSPWAV